MYEDGKANQSLSDEEVLSLAKDRKRAISRRTADISSSSTDNKLNMRDHCLQFDPDFDGQAQRIADALGKESDLAGQLIRIYRPA